jgi:hypothetical protein
MLSKMQAKWRNTIALLRDSDRFGPNRLLKCACVWREPASGFARLMRERPSCRPAAFSAGKEKAPRREGRRGANGRHGWGAGIGARLDLNGDETALFRRPMVSPPVRSPAQGLARGSKRLHRP